MTPWPKTLTVGGLPGTGTTTCCVALKERSGLPYVYVGELFRKLAAEHHMSLSEFGAHAERHPEIDRELDDRQAGLLRGTPLLLEGRLSGFLAYRDRLPAFKAWFTCDPRIRAQRLVGREGGDVDARMAEMRRREDSERKRYLEFYGFDVNELGVYDLVLDTSELSKADVQDAVAQAYERWLRPRRWWWPFGR